MWEVSQSCGIVVHHVREQVVDSQVCIGQLERR